MNNLFIIIFSKDYFLLLFVSLFLTKMATVIYNINNFTELVYIIIFFIFLNIATISKKTRIDRLARIDYEIEKKVETLRNNEIKDNSNN